MARKRIALVLFGGVGERFGGDEPKQFSYLGDQPMMAETLQNLAKIPSIEDIYVVSSPAWMKRTEEVIRLKRIPKIRAIIPGGKTRAESVGLGLSYLTKLSLEAEDLLLIQDGDRPYIDPEIVEENFKAAEKVGAAVTAVVSSDSVIFSPSGLTVGGYRPRKQIYLAQTPQTFRFGIIVAAHNLAKKKHVLGDYTDDGALVSEVLKKPVAIVPGDKRNIKITEKGDEELYLAIKGMKK